MTRRIEQVRLYAPSLRQVALAAPGYYFLTTDTPKVMRWLAEQLRPHGVDLRLGTAFNRCARAGEGWHVEGVGSTRYLVGADGARSRVARALRTGRGATVSSTGSSTNSRAPASPTRCPALLHQQALCARLHRLDRAEPDRRAGRPRACGTIRSTRAFPTSMASCCASAPPAACPGTSSPGTRVPGLIPCSGPVMPIWRDGRDPHRRCRGHRVAGDRRRHPLRMGTRLDAWDARLPRMCANAARRPNRWRSMQRRASAPSAPCAGPSTTCSSTGRSISSCIHRHCDGQPNRSTSMAGAPRPGGGAGGQHLAAV